MNTTIAAIATPPGAGGIGIIRISGPLSSWVLEQVFCPASQAFTGFRPWMLHRGHVVSRDAQHLDDGLAVFMPAPNTFTGEDVVELHCHGGPVLLAIILEELLALDESVRLAERGEFTRRAFMNGRMDLAQAEAVAEMIAAPSREGARLAAAKLDGVLGRRINELREKLEHLRAELCLAVDFPDDEVESLDKEALIASAQEVDAALARLLAGFERTRCWREGVTVALAGPVNAGKSSLMNALLGRERAIVTSTPGTTRDFLEEPIRLGGLAVRLIDTAGLRHTHDHIEAAGIRLGQTMVDAADVIALLVDGAADPTHDENLQQTASLLQTWGPERTVLVWNKADIQRPTPSSAFTHCACAGQVVVSARTGEGLEELGETVRRVVLARAGGQEPEPGEAVPNLRQAQSLRQARQALRTLMDDVANNIPYDVCAVSLESAAQSMGEVTGLDTPENVLNRIFASFCIGK